MKRNMQSVGQQLHSDQRGQVVVTIAVMMAVVLSFASLVIDVGFLYYCHQQLEAATQAAALAGGAAIPAATAVTTAYQYSGDAALGGSPTYNTHSNLNITGATVTLGCISTTAYSNLGLPPCIVYGSQPSANAIRVTETAKVNTFFAKLLGINSVNISATATATAKGGGAKPYNIVLVLDSTASMGTTIDSNCGVHGSQTAEACAQYGIQQLLGQLDPCPVGLNNCGPVTNGMVINPVDPVALMTFPGLCSQTANGMTCPLTATGVANPPKPSKYASDDYNCPTSNPPISAYNNDPAYLVLPYQSNYRPSDTKGLSASSYVVQAVGGGAKPCTMPGIMTPGGEGTFYAGVIDAAQSYLTSTKVTRAGVDPATVQNVIIFLSDGNANASNTQMGGKASSYLAKNECAQAVRAAATAKAAGTLIYSISYGSGASGCTTDNPTMTPCQTMQQMASSPTAQYFFSVPNGKGSTVCAGARPITSLDQVFTAVAGDLTTARLIPNNVPLS